MLIMTKEAMKEALTQGVTATLTEDGWLVGAKIGLFIDDPQLSEDTVFGDLTPPAFTGYAVSAAVVYGTPFSDDDNVYAVGTDMKQFTCTGGTPDDQVSGAFLYKGTTGNEKLLFVERFTDANGDPVQVNINNVGDALRYAMTIRFGPDGDYGKGSLVA